LTLVCSPTPSLLFARFSSGTKLIPTANARSTKHCSKVTRWPESSKRHVMYMALCQPSAKTAERTLSASSIWSIQLICRTGAIRPSSTVLQQKAFHRGSDRFRLRGLKNARNLWGNQAPDSNTCFLVCGTDLPIRL
jgi:hypothetical protein